MGLRTLAGRADFEAFAAEFARVLKPGDVVALAGPLGAGKTTFVRSVVVALHGADTATSPTFTFRHRYAPPPSGSHAGGTAIEHLDLFRVEDPRELRELGLDDAFSGDAIVLVEWWERAPELLPARRYEIEIQGSGEEPRTVSVRAPS
jgi:tRNA threonylcarbamoyladenosine biosynthesis protein TsaE